MEKSESVLGDENVNISKRLIKKKKESKSTIYLPGRPIKKNEELVYDENAYVFFKEINPGAQCLSIDILSDDLQPKIPYVVHLVAGTQTPKGIANFIKVIKFSNLYKNENKELSDSSSIEDELTSDDENGSADISIASIFHKGCVNRIKASQVNGVSLAASWSELGIVSIWNLQKAFDAVQDTVALSIYNKRKEHNASPLATFNHSCEGFALDWSNVMPGFLASGDNMKHIHLWKPHEAGKWFVDQRPYIGHSSSVEDIQWSPNEAHVFASCSSDKSIRIWDSRAPSTKACMIAVNNAHDTDVNVISWNKNEPFIVSGDDIGKILVWDLRVLQTGKYIALFRHHKAPITTVEWHPSDSSVFAVGTEDDQITIWDLSAEKDGEIEEKLDLPPQLLFIHQGQKDVKELHWHPKILGLLISTGSNSINLFKTISI